MRVALRMPSFPRARFPAPFISPKKGKCERYARLLASARGASIASRDDDAAPDGSNFGWMFRRRARIAATAPRRLRPCCAEPSGESAEDIAIGTCRGQIDAKAGRALYHACRDLDQTNADRGELRGRYRRALRSGTAHAKHEPIGGGVQDQAELVGFGIAAGGAVGSELALVQLNEVLGVSPRAIEGLVKMSGAGLERGDDIAHIQPLRRCLDARHEAPLLVPALCTVAKGLEAAQLVFARERALHGDRVGRLARQSMKSIVAGEAKNVVNALGFFAPLHRLVAAVMAVATHQDVDLGPMPADAFDDMLEDSADLFAGWRLALAQDPRHRFPACRIIDVDRQKAALFVLGVEQRELLMAVHRVAGIVDVERDRGRRATVAFAEPIHQRRHQSGDLDLRPRILQPRHRGLRT